METPVVDRTVATLTGTVWHAGPTTVILTLANGENHQYDVPSGHEVRRRWREEGGDGAAAGHEGHRDEGRRNARMELASDSVITGTTK